ncbi:MAG TPA: ATP-binding protein [Terriglobia bacterium]|jgi:hypothetical protein
MPGSEDKLPVESLDAESYRLLVSEVRDYAIFMLDPNGFILSWNEGAKRLKGWTDGEIIGRHFSAFYSEEDKRSRKPERELEIALKEGRVEDEGWRLRKDGTRFWANVVITAVYDNEGAHRGFAKVTRDLTERKRTEESARAELKRLVDERTVELAQANARLEKANLDLHEADRTKDEFLAIISHELRTPLTAIYGWVSLLQRGGANEAKLGKALAVIERNVKAQTQLVDDLLSVSRIVTGKLKIIPAWTDPVALIETAVDSVRPAASAKSIELVVEPANAEPIFADTERMQQVIYNLLTNAIKFTSKDGQIRVEFGRIGSQFQISVSDSGEGIAPDMLPVIFNRFTQEDASSTRRHAGMGLGLSIVRHIIELHGGTAIAHSEGKGRGATFIVRLPIPAVRVLDAERREKDSATLNHVKVLAVEDDPDTADMLCTALEEYGAAVIAANSAAEALEILKTYRPDIILSDLGMPEMDGFEFMKKVRSELGQDLAKTPAIALSAFAGKDHRQRAIRSGYQEHLAKPVAISDLIFLISRFAHRAA